MARLRFALLGLVVAASMLAGSVRLEGAVFVVNRTDDVADSFSGDGVCAVPGGGCTLRAAIMEANADPVGDLIALEQATYVLTLTAGPSDESFGDLDIRAPVGISGTGMRATVISAATGDRVLDVQGGGSSLTLMTLRGGVAGGGGGVRVGAGTYLRCNFCVIRDNRSTADGGGVEALGDGFVELIHTIVASNLAAGCGGGVATHGVAQFASAQLSHNRALSSGGGACALGADSALQFFQTTVDGNVAAVNGGGLEINAGEYTMINSTVSGNAAARGGGLHLTGGATTAPGCSHVTVASNRASIEAGGVWVEGGSTLSLSNLLLGDNLAPASPDCLGTLSSSAGHNLVENPSGCTLAGNANGYVTNQDPLLLPLANRGAFTPTHELASEQSPAHDAGADALRSEDQRQYERPNGVHADIGATEFYGIVPALTLGSFDYNALEWDGTPTRFEPTMRNLVSRFRTQVDGALGPMGIGPALTVDDAAASYGLIAGGSASSCFTATGDCYSVRLALPAGQSRLPGHVDAYASEVAGPSRNYWRVHVGGTFADVDAVSLPHSYETIEGLAHSHATAGCTPTRYCPDNGLTRRQAALLLERALGGEFPLPHVQSGAVFADVPLSDPFAPWIERLVADGVSQGCAPDPDGAGPQLARYCPDGQMRRDQLARWLLRLGHGPAWTPPACSANLGEDLPASDPYCPWIQAAGQEGLYVACAGDPDGGGPRLPSFCPRHAVTRGEASVKIWLALLPRSWSLGL